MDQKTKRATILKRLFEAQKSKVPTEMAEEERNKEASSLMDRLVGPDWRVEIQLPDITIMQVPPPPPKQEQHRGCSVSNPVSPVGAVNQAAESFYERVLEAMDAEGIGMVDAFEWDNGSSSDPKDSAKRLKLADKVLRTKDASDEDDEEEDED